MDADDYPFVDFHHLSLSGFHRSYPLWVLCLISASVVALEPKPMSKPTYPFTVSVSCFTPKSSSAAVEAA